MNKKLIAVATMCIAQGATTVSAINGMALKCCVNAKALRTEVSSMLSAQAEALRDFEGWTNIFA